MTLNPNIQRGWLLLALVGAPGAGSSVALAHSLHVMYGELVVHVDRVVLAIETDGSSLAHWSGASEACLEGNALRDAIYAQSNLLARGLVLRDTAGKRLQIGRVELPLKKLETGITSDESLSYSIEFRGGAGGSLLVLQYLPVAESRHREQIAMVVQGVGDDQQDLIYLTSGGNVEYLDVRREAQSVAGEAGVAADAKTQQRVRVASTTHFSRPSISLSSDSAGLDATIHMPLNMLRMWVTAETRLPDFFTEREWEASLPEMRRLFERAMSIESGQSTESNQPIIWPQLVSCTFVSANGSRAQEASISIWTNLVEARLRWPQAPTDANVAWRLFNSRLRVIEVEAAGGQVKRQLSSYAPHMPVRDTHVP